MDPHPLFVNLPRLLEAIRKYNGTATDIAVMKDISQFANRQGRSFTTERAIAARNGLRRKAVSRSVNWIAAHGIMLIKREKRGQDKHPRNNYYIAKPFRLDRPDKQSEHYNESKWQRWCEIGKKRFYNALKKKQAAQAAAGTIRDTAARMAAAKHPASASPTPAQASQARQQRGGGFAAFGSVLAGLFKATPAAAATPAVADTYAMELQRRGDIAQTLRQNEARQQAAQAAAVMAIQLPQQQAAPMVATLAVPPMTQDRAAASQSQPEPVSTASKQYETDLSDEPLPDYYLQQQEAATATAEHTWRDNVPGYRHETATVTTGPTTTAPAETVAANCQSEPSYVPGEWRHNVPAEYRHETATVDAMKPITETPEQASQARGDTVPPHGTWRARCRLYEAQGLIKLKPGSPATVEG